MILNRLLAKAAAGELAPIPSSGPMVRSCALSGMGGWHWREQMATKKRRSFDHGGQWNGAETVWKYFGWGAWAALLRGFETRQFGKIAKISGPRIFMSEGRKDVENTGFEGYIVISLSIAGLDSVYTSLT